MNVGWVATDAERSLLETWAINNRVNVFLAKNLSPELWTARLPGAQRRTVGSVMAHIHNARGMWLRSLGAGAGIAPPPKLAAADATAASLTAALEESGRAIHGLLVAGLAAGGRFPGVKGNFFFGAMPVNAVHFVGYAVAHEAHHRGQVVLLARQLGHRLPASVTGGLWQWSSRLREGRDS